jgi:hypothetical protein
MKFSRTFSAPVPEAIARERTQEYLTHFHFKQLPSSNGRLLFKRGSIWGTLFSFNPSKWACQVDINITPDANWTKIEMNAEISTDPTEKRFAEELLTAEFSLLEASISIDEKKCYNITTLQRRISGHVMRIVKVVGLSMLSVIIGIGAGQLVSKNTNVSILLSSIIGAAVSLIMMAIFQLLMGRPKEG